jgi:hypothetical protein
MIKQCQNCKIEFEITDDDMGFYERIKVPSPTFCPHCRFIRRLIWRNERSLYKRTCDLCKKNIIAMYDEKVNFPVYCTDCFNSDSWDPQTYGLDYDFNKSFFEQFKKLFDKVPRQSLWQYNNVNSEYSNLCFSAKNVYLGFSVLVDSEDVYYSTNINHSKLIVDSYNVVDSELNYEVLGAFKNYNCQYSYWSSNCINCNFVLDCNNCQDCFGCVNLQNKKYCIWNNQYDKEDYESKVKEFDTGSYVLMNKLSNKFWEFSLKYPRKYGRVINSINSSGDNLRNNKNTINCFNSYDSENIKYGYRAFDMKDSMDVTHCSYASLLYEHGLSGSNNSQNIKFIINGNGSQNNDEYTDFCKSSSNLFGCIAIKNRQYCILNKQYTKDKYFEMIDKIKKHMNDLPYVDKKGNIYKYGEFFPTEFCPFGYNESATNDHFPLTSEEIIKNGYPYKEKFDNKYIITLEAKNIPDNIKEVNDSILNEVIKCSYSGKAFKITPFEFNFYKRMNIPFPRLHPDERHKNRLAKINPMILYKRNCMKEGCSNSFETTYAPDRSEIIYCKDCYQQEVY